MMLHPAGLSFANSLIPIITSLRISDLLTDDSLQTNRRFPGRWKHEACN